MLAREVGPLGAIASWWGSLACALLYLSFQTRQSKISWRFIAIYSARYIEPKDKALSSSLSSRFAYESEMIRCSEIVRRKTGNTSPRVLFPFILFFHFKDNGVICSLLYLTHFRSTIHSRKLIFREEQNKFDSSN